MSPFAIEDIHGGLKAFHQVFNQIEVTEDDKLIFMGDFVSKYLYKKITTL